MDELYSECEERQCPFHSCMGQDACMLVSVAHSAPHLIREHARYINYCDKPRLLLEEKYIKKQPTGMTLDECHAHIPDKTPLELMRYATEDVFRKKRYIFTKGKSPHQMGYCTYCEEEFPTAGLKHKQDTVCPHCQSECKVQNAGMSRKYMVDEAFFTYYMKSVIDPSAIVAVGMFAVRDFSGSYRRVDTQYEATCLYVFRPGLGGTAFIRSIYYNFGERKIVTYRPYTRQVNVRCQFNRDRYGHMPVFYSRESIAEAVQNTPFKYSTWESYDINDLTEFFDLYARYPSIEYLTKLGFAHLVRDKINRHATHHAINWRGETVLKVLKLTKEELRIIKEQKLTMEFEALRALHLAKKAGPALHPTEAIRIGQVFNIYMQELYQLWKERAPWVTFVQLMKYFRRQVSEDNFRDEKSVLFAWRDYLRECTQLGYDLTRHRTVFPKDLYSAHQETTKQVKIKESAPLKERVRERATELKKLSFANSVYLIRPAASVEELVTEGSELKHCVGGYSKQYASCQSDIFVIRRTEEPDKPFFTLEVRGKHIAQCYGLKHSRPDAELQAFIDLFKNAKLKRHKPNKKERLEVAI